MKINEIFTEEEQQTDLRDLGMFIAYSLDGRSAKAIKHFCEDNGIPNCVELDEMHVSLIYSKTFDSDFVPEGILKEPLLIRDFELDIWKTQDNSNALVAKFESQKLQDIYNDLIHKYDFDNVYEEFKPHFTISYDIEDAEIDTKRQLLEFNEYVPYVHLVEQYSEPLKQDWIKQQKRKKKEDKKK